LFLGYQGAVGAFDSAAKAFGVSLPEQTIVEVVQAWRKSNPEIVTWWYELEEAAKRAVKNPGNAYRARRVSFRKERDWLWCKLPSGRLLPYFKPELRDGSLVYQGVLMGRWADIDTFGGKIAENICQAASRDVMAHNMPLVERRLYPIVTTVHDEIVTEVADSPDYTPAGLADAMGNVPPWCPDLPLAVTAWEGKRYRK
jgi:DNA polymerase bacteriophage-type